MLYCNSGTRFADIRDGSTHTLLIGECVLDAGDPSDDGKVGAIWAGMRGSIGTSVYVSDTCWFLNPDPDWRINGREKQALGSRHSGGVNFVFGDGSVRYVSDYVDDDTLLGLAARADGQVLGEF